MVEQTLAHGALHLRIYARIPDAWAVASASELDDACSKLLWHDDERVSEKNAVACHAETVKLVLVLL